MNPNNQLRTPTGYNGRTSATGYDLSFEYATRGIVRGFTMNQGSGLVINISSSAEERALAIASDDIEKTPVFMDPGESFSMTLQKLPATSHHTIIVVVKAVPTGAPSEPDNPESVAVFEVPANMRPLTDEELAEHVKTSPSLGQFQGGKWCRIGDVMTIGDMIEDVFPGGESVSTLPTRAFIADGSVTYKKLATNSVTNIKIADGAVTDNKIFWGSIKTSARIKLGENFPTGTIKTIQKFGILEAQTAIAFDNYLTITDVGSGQIIWQAEPRPKEGWAIMPLNIVVFAGQQLRFDRNVESSNVRWNEVWLRPII